MKYLKIFWNEFAFDEEWGKSIWFFEIGEDNYIKRQLEVFENTNRIKFDKNHWVDSYGSLGDQPITLKELLEQEEFKAEEISATDFESEWAIKSLNMG